MSVDLRNDVAALLFVCGNTPLQTSQACRLPASEEEWNGVVAAARHHGLLGLLDARIRSDATVPKEIRSQVRSDALSQCIRNLQMVNALAEINRTFRANGVLLVVLKGPAVAVLGGHSVCTREFTDLDLLVRFADLDRAASLLQDLGYAQVGVTSGTRKTRKDIAFSRSSDDLVVELHWLLNLPAMRFPLEETGLWSRIQTISLQNEVVATLGMEDTLIALCIHGAIHGWTSLKWCLDIANLLRQHTATIDWKTLLVRSRTARCSRGVLAGLQLASLMFDAPIPKAVHTAAAKDVCSRKLAVQFRGIILQSKPLNQVERIAATIMIHDRFWDRLILILATVRARFQPARGGIAARWIPLLIGKRVVPLVRRYGLGWLRLAAFLR